MDLDELSSERIQQLEALVTEYKGTVQELQRELDERGTDGAVKGGTAALQRLQEELEAERTSNASLQAGASPSPPPHPTPSPIHPLTHPPHTALEAASQASTAHEAQIEQLEQTLFELRGEIGAGRHVPPGVRVLSLRENPAQAWADASQAAVERLRRENEALMRRLQELEDAGVRAEKGKGKAGEGKEGEGGEGAMVPRESWEVVNREKARLEEELKQKEKRLKRLQEVRPRPLHTPSVHTTLTHRVPTDLPVQIRRVPRGRRLDPRGEARVLPERPGARHLALRPQRRVRLPAHPLQRGKGGDADAARGAGRRRPGGSAAIDALLGRAGAVHPRFPRERHARVL